MDHLPSLTLLIPTYNRAEALRQTLDALVDNEYLSSLAGDK
jgi:glycosyltransferase involved in cell wall biosynthesis